METRLSKGEKRMWRMKRGWNERGRGRVRGWKRKEGSTRYNKGARSVARARALNSHNPFLLFHPRYFLSAGHYAFFFAYITKNAGETFHTRAFTSGRESALLNPSSRARRRRVGGGKGKSTHANYRHYNAVTFGRESKKEKDRKKRNRKREKSRVE